MKNKKFSKKKKRIPSGYFSVINEFECYITNDQWIVNLYVSKEIENTDKSNMYYGHCYIEDNPKTRFPHLYKEQFHKVLK